MKKFYYFPKFSAVVYLVLFFSTFFNLTAQKKLPSNPYTTNLANCPNPIIGCSLFSNPQNYTCASSFTYAAATNDNECLTGPTGAIYECLGTIRNQMWFIITAQTSGNLSFSFSNSNFKDVDGIIWGAISNNDPANACASTMNAPLSCDFSSNDVVSLSINAVAGQKYVMMIANYSNSATNVNITQPSGGTVSYCKVNANTCVAPTATVSGNSTINQGQSANISLAFTGAAPYTYTLSDGQTGTTSTNPLTILVSPLSTTTYTVTSIRNACGAGTSSGSGVVTVSRTVELVSCFPFNNNSSDQIGSNNGGINANGGNASFTTNRNATVTSAISISNGAYMQFPTTNLLNNTFTHSLWVSPSSVPTNGNFNYILSIGGIGQSQELYLENEAGVVKWVFRSSTTSGNIDVKYPANITLGQWYHVAIVRTANALQMYVNGVLVQSSPASGLSSTYSSPSIGRLGTQSSGLVNFFNGKIDDVRLFKGGLNGLEIASLYSSTVDCPPIVGVPLISMTNITNSTLCRNQLESVNFQQSEVTAGSTYTVQLSDATGSFTNPIAMGTGTLPPIQVSIPPTVTTSGSGYLIRIINGSTISFNTLPITILPTATGTISGTATINEGQSTNLTINFTGTSPWTYSISDGVNSTSYSSTTATATQSVSPLTTTTYTLSSVKDNTCGTGTGSGSAVITVNSTTQLLACYPFSGNALDSKGTYHGTVNGATLTTDRFGNANSAYNFDGSSNYISIPGANLAPSQFTYSAWVNASDLPALDVARTILSIGNDGGDQHYRLFNSSVTSGPAWNFNSYTGYNVVAPLLFSYTSVLANTWIHVVVVRSSTGRKIYINGVLSVNDGGLANPYYSTPILGKIGSRYNGIQPFKGKIDDVKIYSGTLNDTQVQAIYLAEQQCPTVETGGLIVATSVSSATSCPSGTFTVNVLTNNVTTNSGNPLKVELSNSSGLFTNPTQIGSGTTNSISCTIPAGTVAGNYKVRVVSGTTPSQVISVNSLPIVINPAVTATILGSTTILSGNTATLTVNFTGVGPWTYTVSGINITSTTSSSSITLSVSPTTTTTYTVQSVNNACGIGTTSGSAIITVVTFPQLLACYKFEGNALDSKGNHHGTVNGATLTTDRFGKANAAYNFNGSSNIQLSNPTDFGITTFTWSAWVNASVLATLNVPKTVFSVGYDGGDQHINMFYWSTSGQTGWNYGSYTGYATVATPLMISYTSISTNNWVHLAVVRTATERKLYINGQLSLSGTAAPAFYNTPISAAIGSRYNGIQPFSGKIDDVKFYNGALSDEEISLLYNEEQGECSSPCDGMIYSLGSGDWSNTSTWSCGRVPQLADKVLIKAGHNVTVSTNSAKARKLLNSGQISFANSTSKLTFGNGTVQTIAFTSQPNPSNSKDSFISSFVPNTNHGTSNYMGPYAGTQGGITNLNRTFVAFDLSSIPTNAVVDSAYLNLYYSQAVIDIFYPQSTYFDGHVGDTRFWVQKITQPWSASTITWNNQPTATTINQIGIPVHTSKTQNYKIDVKNFVQDMVLNPVNNHGFMLKLQNETPYTLVALTSSDDANPNIRPKIQVYYRLP
jgi:Concanavalin A-like lectin/glucanases superfamily